MHAKITLLGLDRLNTSFALALKRYQDQPKADHTFTFIGYDSDAQQRKNAEALKVFDQLHRSAAKAVTDADLIIVRVPYHELEDLYAQIGPAMKSGAVVLDMTPLKLPALEWAGQHIRTNEQGEASAFLVGITPILAADKLYDSAWTLDSAQAELFDNAEFLITPDATCPQGAIALAEDVIQLVGGTARFMDPGEHDGLIAATEALPSLLGTGLFYTLQQSDGWSELRRMINPSLALAMQNLRYQTSQDNRVFFTHTRENLARHIEGLVGTLNDLQTALLDDEPEQLEAFLVRVQEEWDKWDIKRHSGNWDKSPLPDIKPSGMFGGLLGMRRPPRDDEGR